MTTPSAPRVLAIRMSSRMTSSSSALYKKSPPRGRMMTCSPIFSERLATLMQPALGVVPPSNKLAHSSTRSAPARSATKAPEAESTQISMRIGLGEYVNLHKWHKLERSQNFLGRCPRVSGLINWTSNHQPVRACGQGFFCGQCAFLIVGFLGASANTGSDELHCARQDLA